MPQGPVSMVGVAGGVQGIGRRPSSSLYGGMIMPVWYDDPTDAGDSNQDDYRFYIQSIEDARYGIEVVLRKAATTSNVHVIRSILAGRLYPAYYWGYDPDDETATESPVSNNWKYRTMDADGEYMDYTIPAAAAGMDVLGVAYWLVSGSGGTCSVQVNGVEVGTIDTGTGVTGHYIEYIELDTPLVAGQTIRLEGTEAVNTRIHGILAYNSNGTVSGDDKRHMVASEQTNLITSGSAMEVALHIAQTGDAEKWIGAQHQSADDYDPNGAQVSPTEAFLVDSASWTLAVGYKQGKIEIVRSSTLRYDATPTDMGTLYETYEIGGDYLRYSWKMVASAGLDTDRLYGGMFPAIEALESVRLDNQADYDFDTIATSESDNHDFGLVHAMRFDVGNMVCPTMRCHVYPVPDSTFIWSNDSGNYRKAYWPIYVPTEAIASGASIGGTWMLTV